jgi:hypothetical protein
MSLLLFLILEVVLVGFRPSLVEVVLELLGVQAWRFFFQMIQLLKRTTLWHLA